MVEKYSYTQNFLKSSVISEIFPKVVHVSPGLPIVDIGAGSGNIAQWLLQKYTNRVIAFEIDPVLKARLREEIVNPRLTIFANYFERPIGEAYQVVSNIPFISTTEIIDTLSKDIFFQTGYIIMQKEAAERIGGSQVNAPSTLRSILLENAFTIRIVHTFSSKDFEPAPSVNIVMVEMKRKQAPVFMQKNLQLFEGLVSYLFQHSHPILRRSPLLGRYLARRINFADIPILQKTPSEATFDEYHKLFRTCERAMLYKVQDTLAELKEQQKSLQKVYRTRQAADWNK